MQGVCQFSSLFRRMADSTALAVLFVWAVHAAKIHAGSIPAPLLPAPGEFALLFMLGTAWHVTARATGLYDPARHVSLTAELLTLGKNVSCQFVALAVTLFFLKSLELNRFFTLLYSAGLLGATVMVRLAARAGRQAHPLE
jgi:hypothetical protein